MVNREVPECEWLVCEQEVQASTFLGEGLEAVPCLSCIAEVSMGRAVKHISMRNGVKAWSIHNDLSLGDDQIADLAYSLRAMTAQLMNMKSQAMQIPKQWAPKFEAFYSKIAV